MKDKKTETKRRILKPVEASKPKRHSKTPETYKKALRRSINSVKKKVERMDTLRGEYPLLKTISFSLLLLRFLRSVGVVGLSPISVFYEIAIDSLSGGDGLSLNAVMGLIGRTDHTVMSRHLLLLYKLGLIDRKRTDTSSSYYVYYLSVYSVERLQELLNEV